MSTRQINITETTCAPINIGQQAEKGVSAIEFDLTSWVELYGAGTASISMQRWGDTDPYPVALSIDAENKATWTLSDTDLAKEGLAYAQLSYNTTDGTKTKKSIIYTLRIADSLDADGDAPDAYESWLATLQTMAASAMAEALDMEGVATDTTLSVEGGIADAKATGDAIAALAATVPAVDAALTTSGSAADAKATGDEIRTIKADLRAIDTATASDVGMALIVESVTDGKASFTFDEAGASVEIDATLSVSGEAADAKATGDAISALEASVAAISFDIVVDDNGNATIERSDLTDTSEVSY